MHFDIFGTKYTIRYREVPLGRIWNCWPAKCESPGIIGKLCYNLLNYADYLFEIIHLEGMGVTISEGKSSRQL